MDSAEVVSVESMLQCHHFESSTYFCLDLLQCSKINEILIIILKVVSVTLMISMPKIYEKPYVPVSNSMHQVSKPET